MTSRGPRVPIRVVFGVLVWALAAGMSAAGRSPTSGNPADSAIIEKGAVPLFRGAALEKGGRPLLGAAPQAGAYIGDDTCVACHEAEGKTLAGTLHGKAQNVRTPSAKTNQACETCHGPGKDHAESGDKDKIRRLHVMPPREASETCLSCHTRGGHVNWKGGMHDARNLS